jgi:hypothetical protein
MSKKAWAAWNSFSRLLRRGVQPSASVAGGVAVDFHGPGEDMVGGGCGGKVIMAAVLFQPGPAGSSVCEFRTPDRHRLPQLDQAVVPA